VSKVLASADNGTIQIIQQGGWLKAMIDGEHVDTRLITQDMSSRDAAKDFLNFILEEE